MKAKYKHIKFNLIKKKEVVERRIIIRLQETMRNSKISEEEIKSFVGSITQRDYHYLIIKIIDNFDCST